MTAKDRTAHDVNRAANAGQQPDLTQMMTLLIQQQAQTHALLQRLLPAVTQPALPAPDGPRLTDRALVSREVDEYCHQTQEAHGDVWRWLYRQWARTGRGNSKTRIDDIARDGHMAEFLAFVKRELPNKPPHRPDAPVKRQPAEHIPNEELAAAIQSAGVSPCEIARRAGLSIETVRKALNGKVPGIRTRRQIAAALGTVVDRLWLSDDEIAAKLAGKALAATEGP